MNDSVVSDGGFQALRLETQGGGSILGKSVQIDLDQRPILSWNWKVESGISVQDETREAEDDHPARLFLSFAPPADQSWWNRLKYGFFNLLGGIPYHGRGFEIVWGNNLTGEPNCSMKLYYIHGFPHYVQRGGDQQLKKWWSEAVNLKTIYKKIWPGEPVPDLIFVGLMNDSEVTRQKAISYFSNVRISGQ